MRTLLITFLALTTGLVAGASWAQDGATDGSTPKPQEAFELDALLEKLDERGGPWIAFLDRPDLSAGIYRLKAGAKDGQGPHDDDEVYYVIEGTATLTAGDEELPVTPGSIVYVEKNVVHHFHDIEEDLVVLVFFAKKRR
jgi:mannose-6-phosphate isomerase-like protein (cupin superfamily)